MAVVYDDKGNEIQCQDSQVESLLKAGYTKESYSSNSSKKSMDEESSEPQNEEKTN